MLNTPKTIAMNVVSTEVVNGQLVVELQQKHSDNVRVVRFAFDTIDATSLMKALSGFLGP